MYKVLILSFFVFIIGSCHRNQPPLDVEKQKIDKLCDSMMSLFRDEKLKEALTLLKKNSVIAESTIDTLESTVNAQFKDYLPAYGKIVGMEFIREHKIKDFISKRFYILRFEKYYLKFDFTIYKTNIGWAVTNFKYDEDIIELLF